MAPGRKHHETRDRKTDDSTKGSRAQTEGVGHALSELHRLKNSLLLAPNKSFTPSALTLDH